MRKKRYKRKQKKKKTILNILKNYATVITIGMSILAVIANIIIKYYKNSISTDFYFQYLTVNIDNEDFVKNFKNKEYGGYYHNVLQAPTYNNDLNKILYKEPKKVIGYYITYLILEQTKDIEATDIKLNFKQFGKANNFKNKNLTDFPIKMNKGISISKKINYPFPKGEKLKIPISICKNNNEYTLELTNCYYLQYKPTSIEYKNKYISSKRKVPIRDYIKKNVIIDGEVITGKGSV